MLVQSRHYRSTNWSPGQQFISFVEINCALSTECRNLPNGLYLLVTTLFNVINSLWIILASVLSRNAVTCQYSHSNAETALYLVLVAFNLVAYSTEFNDYLQEWRTLCFINFRGKRSNNLLPIATIKETTYASLLIVVLNFSKRKIMLYSNK